jgi:hypothetical protein
MLEEVVIHTRGTPAQGALSPRGSGFSKQPVKRGLPFSEFSQCIKLIVNCSLHTIIWNLVAFSFTHAIVTDILYVEKRLDAKCDPDRDALLCEHEFHTAGECL